ncbi:MAG: flagellar export chaperone FliS [Syntrophomonadaceae bacterium]|jgi:flagellar protein FliS
MHAQVYDQYRKTTVETLSPAKLLLMLYDGALNSLRNAQKAIEEKDISQAHNQLIKAQDIIAELMATLNMEVPISRQLYALYDYIQRRLIEANINKDIAIIDEAYQFISELRDAFAQAAYAAKRSQVQNPAKQLNIMG